MAVDIELHDHTMVVRLNRPEAGNALDPDTGLGLLDAFGRAVHDDVRAVVLTGAGEKIFCAGMDLKAFAAGVDTAPIGHGIAALRSCEKPVIAAVNGAAVGVGATMQLPMDFRIASTTAKFGFVFSRRGITPEACSSWFLPRIVGIAQALEWVYSAEILKPEQALAGRFVSAVVPADQLLEEAYKIARRIAQHSPVAIALTRQMMYRCSAQAHPIEAHKVDSLAIYYASRNSGKEGVKSFLEKRAPVFEDRTSTDMPSFYPWWN